MTFVRTLKLQQSGNMEPDTIQDLFKVSSDATASRSGGFLDDWDDAGMPPSGSGEQENNSTTPVNLLYYRVRIYTDKPMILYSSQVDNYSLTRLAPGGTDTTFSQWNMTNGVIKKWTLTDEGRTWSELKHSFYPSKKRKKSASGRHDSGNELKNAVWKLQLFNPGAQEGTGLYYAIIEAHMDYDSA